MKLQFDAKQDYQLDAIRSIADLFEGEGFTPAELIFSAEGSFGIMPNRLSIGDEILLRNLQQVQSDNKVAIDSALKTIGAVIDTDTGKQAIQFPNFSVEMETGTGKTYVYIRTALELAQRYGMRKFIIVVPTVAVREGVLKTLEITKTHLSELYGNMPYRYTAYDSGSLSRLRQFAESNIVEFLIMTLASFNKDANVIRQEGRDQMYGVPPIYLVQRSRPILILDEPQNFTSALSELALASLNPLFALRYSATHPKGKEFNRVYRLSPFEAYRRGLVKKIEVAGVEQVDVAPAFIRVESVTSKKSVFTIQMTVHVLDKNGTVKEKTLSFKPDGKSLEEKTHLPDYRQYVIDYVETSDQSVYFTNGLHLRAGEARGNDKTAIFDAQIRYTVREHFRKQARLRQQGIKVLTLFFIDRVDNYASEQGLIRTAFIHAFNELKVDYPDWRDVDPEVVQGAYFAQQRNRQGAVTMLESKSGDSEKDKDAYDLIMKDKETLLSLPTESDDPDTRRRKLVCFIFSHSALREGWDNPNIFQICTLNQSVSDMKKRQEIGRGVRLAVNQTGERVFDDRVNILTVVANQSYEEYVAALQSEIVEEYGSEGAPPKPADARNRSAAKLQKAAYISDEFRELWERIKHKTRYNVQLDSEQLISAVVADLDKEVIQRSQIVIIRGRIEVQDDSNQFDPVQTGSAQVINAPAVKAVTPNVVLLMAHMLQYTTPPLRLTRRTLFNIVQRTTNRHAALESPQEFAAATVRIIRSRMAEQLVDGIQYERTDEAYEMTQFESEIQSWEEFLQKAEHCLYDHVIYESEVERQFVLDLEKWDAVKLYIKLPSWFMVPTPVGNYNPDWAIVIEPRDEYGEKTGEEYTYLVSETKSTTDLSKLRPDEARKILCGEAHFTKALGVVYKHVVRVGELR